MKDLIPGIKYRFTYQIPGMHRKPRWCVAKFVSKDGDMYVLSGRPEFGSSELDARWVSEILPVDQASECYADRRATV